MKTITATDSITTLFPQFRADRDGAQPTCRCLPGLYERENCEEWAEQGWIDGEPAKVFYIFDRTKDGIDGDAETYPWDADHVTKIEIGADE